MKPWLKFCTYGLRTCALWLASYLLWTIWLTLGLLLTAQIYIATSSELAVPAFLLRRLEARLADSGINLTFGRTSFDPTGRVLLEDVRISLPAFPEPVLTTRAVYFQINPRALFLGNLEPAEIHVTHASLIAPAQLTPSGRREEMLSALEATLVPRGHELLIRQFSARLATLPVSVLGSIPLPPANGKTPGPPVRELIARHFSTACRQILATQEKLARCDDPALFLEVTPSAAGTLTIAATVLARRVSLDAPLAMEADSVVARTRLVLLGDAPPLPLELSAATLRLPNETLVRGLQAEIAARLRPGTLGVDLREALVTVDSIDAAGVDARSLSARLTPRPLPQIEAEGAARVLGTPLGLHTTADLTAGTARVRFAGSVSPRVLDFISQRLGNDVRRFVQFDRVDAEEAEAEFGAGWKFEKLTARVHVPQLLAQGVSLSDGRALVELQPGYLRSPEVSAHSGDNFARGTYEHNLRTQEFRFLLEGRLRPLVISPWFSQWWPNFFRQFEFPVAPIEANIDLRGVWRQQGRQSRVFLLAETPKAIIRGAELDLIRTRLFIRPGYVDALEVLAQRHDGEIRGLFTYRANADAEWQSLDFSAESTLEYPLITQLLGPNIAKHLTPYRVSAHPLLNVQGSLHGPTSGRSHNDFLRIDARTSGDFGFYDFPLQDVAFLATIRGGEVNVERFNGVYADGAVSGNARVWGTGENRQVGFNAALENANLGQAATKLQAYLAQRRGRPPPPPDRFVQERANLRLDVAASGVGIHDDPLSFHGDGNATLKGPGIGEVPLLGLLSELFTFTSLRFTEARGNFKIDGPRLVFPKIELRGANSAIDAHGDYSLERNEFNFIAKVFPFQESGNVFKSVVGVVLTPLSNVLEVKLTGTFEKPHWAFVMGPLNLLRSITEGGAEPAPPAAIAPAAPASKPAEPATPVEPPPARPQ